MGHNHFAPVSRVLVVLCLGSIFAEKLFAPFFLAQISVVSDGGGTGAVSMPLSGSIIVQVNGEDQSGSFVTPVPGVRMVFSLTSPAGATGATLSQTAATTGIDGRASTMLTFGNLPGLYQVSVACLPTCAATPIIIRETAVDASYTLSAGNVHPITGLVRSVVPTLVQALVRDSTGQPVSSVPVQFSITQDPSGGNASLSPTAGTMVTTDASGSATTQVTTGDKAGVYVVTAFCGTTVTCLPSSVPVSILTGCSIPVPSLPQAGLNGPSQPWGSDPYDHLAITIARKGCALTSLNMALNYASLSWNPGSLNSLLSIAGGYTPSPDGVRGGNVDWIPAVRLGALNNTSIHYDELGGSIDSRFNPMAAQDLLETNVCAATPFPVIVAVRSPSSHKFAGHFVLVTGETILISGARQFTINDPAGLGTSLSDARYSSPTGNPEFQTRGTVHDPPNPSGFSLSIDANASMLVTDASNFQTGFDPSSGVPIQTIPHSAAYLDELDDDVTGDPGPPQQSVVVNSFTAGSYRVVFTGKGTGTFPLSVSAVSQDGSVQPSGQLQVRVVPGSTSTVMLSVSNLVNSSPVLAAIMGDINGDGIVSCADIGIVRASFGKKAGQPGVDARADVNFDGVVDIRDLATVSQQLPVGTRCQ